MGSVSSISPGLEYLFQTLSNVNSPVLQSPSTVSALEKASPADTLQLSLAATQLQEADAMFGTSGSPVESPTASMNSILAGLGTAQASTSSATPGSEPATPASPSSSAPPSATGSPSDQLAGYQSAMQSAEVEGLLGMDSNTGIAPSLFNVIG